MLETLKLIYKANNQGVYLWVEEDKLKSRFPKSFDDKTLIEQLGKNKESIIELLKHNQVDSAKLKLPTVYKDPTIEAYSLSFGQERLWFVEQYEQGTNAYHIPMLVKLKNSTDQKKLKDAIKKVVQRHEILRTVFKQNDDQYIQIVLEKTLEINEYHHSTNDLDTQLEKDITTPFDLQTDFPLRANLYHKEDCTNLLINMHHIASDGWSSGILLKEINALYNNEWLPDLNIQYKDFSVWQREYLKGEKLQEQIEYWKGKLQGHESLNLPFDKTRPKQIDYSGDDVSFSINETISSKLRKLSEEQGCTLYATLLSGFYILLNKYSGQDDILIGAPIANRHYAAIQDLIGFFVNSSALREQINQENDVIALLSQVKKTSMESQQYQDLPFEKIVELLDVGQDPSRQPLFQVTFSLQSFGGKTENNLFTPLSTVDKLSTAKYDLSCFVDDSKDEIQGSLNFATALYEKATIKGMANHYLLILEQMVNTPNKQIKDYNLLTDTEYQEIVIDWNKTDSSYRKDKTIQELFEQQVVENPNHLALVFNEEQLTYSELNVKANQLARHLRASTDIQQDKIIAICLDKSIEMVIGILGVLKAGAAYVPIDPEYPTERIQYILEDAQTKIAITQAHLIEGLKKISSIDFVSLDSDCYQDQETSNLSTLRNATDLAYVIYTSGTTGKPKGVMAIHQGVINLIDHFSNIKALKSTDNCSAWTNLSFDVSVYELISPLLSGATLFPVPSNVRMDSKLLFQWIEKCKITSAYIPAFFLEEYKDFIIEKDYKMQRLLVGVEPIQINLLQQIKNQFEQGAVINGYGPSEATVCSTLYEVQSNSTVFDNVITPIGQPINNVKVYILDSYNNVVPKGVTGELCISGAGLVKGYLGKSELTAEKFVPNPFSSKDDLEKGYSTLYKTGDLVRLLPDGNIQFIGRNDFQVKIRGYRIELGEIESVLSRLESIKQVCVLAKEDNNKKYLVAYYVSDTDLSENEIRTSLSNQIPEYMIPSAFVALDTFPLTPNGKIDRKALPDPNFSQEDSYVAPITELEQTLCTIWQELLNIEQISVTDDFFRIGGDSILSIQLSSRLRKQDLHCSMKVLFEHRTIERLAHFLSNNSTEVKVISEQGELQGSFDLLPVQKWFFDKKENKQFSAFNHWNQSLLVKVPQLDLDKLQSVIEQLTIQHDMLRVSFTDNQQTYKSEIAIPKFQQLNVKNKSEEEITNTLTNWQSNFDIHNGPLWNISYIEGYEDNSARLYFALHHLIVDAVSLRILIDDFKALYSNEPITEKTSSYRQWINELSSYEEKHPKEKEYWSSLISKTPSYSIEESKPFNTSVKLSKDYTTALLNQTNNAYQTEVNDLLLTALGQALRDWNNSSIQQITLEGHGRESISDTIDHRKTVGWFTTMYPVQLNVQEDLTASIKSIKETLRAIPNKGIGFGAIYPTELINLPEISFNYLGQFDTQDEFWQIASEGSGTSVHDENNENNIIAINGMVTQGELTFNVNTKLGESETLRFIDDFKYHLEDIITHCKNKVEQDEVQYTPSDFGTVSISQSLLDKIQQNQ